jgi:maltooligosyltrehalose synthase
MDASALARSWTDGAVKARVFVEGLRARAERPDLFARGDLSLLPLSGSAAPHSLALARRAGDDLALAVIPLRPLRLLSAEGLALEPRSLGLDLPLALRERFTGTPLAPGPADLAAAMGGFPVLLATSW